MTESERSPQEMLASALGLLIRRKWTVLLSFLVVSVGTIVVANQLPRKYVSEAVLVVPQPKISSEFASPNEKTSPLDDVQVMKREILSDVRLAAIIQEEGLYPERRTDRLDILAARMREDIDIQPVDEVRRGEFRAFRVSFIAGTPEVARGTVQKLVSLFLEMNGRDREERVTRTADYLSTETAAAKQRLDEQERRLRSAMLRSAQEDNSRKVAAGTVAELRTRLINTQASLRSLQDRKFSLESTIQGTLTALQADKEALLKKYTAQYAEVIKKDQQMARLQALLSQLRLKTIPSDNGSGIDDPATAQIRAQVFSVVSELGNLAREEQQIQAELIGAQQGESAASVHELEVDEIQRDVDLFRKAYADSLAQQQKAEKQAGIEGKQEVQTYRLIDPPTLPVQPISPKLIKLDLGGVAAGLFAGLALAVLAELRKGAFHTESELARLAQVPLILSIPVMQTRAELRRKRILLFTEWLGASAIIVIVAAAELYVFRNR